MSDKFVEWEERFSLGIKQIDDEHKKLIDFTNELFEGVRQGPEKAESHFRETVKNAVNYVKTHFTNEEGLFQKHGYPDYVAHKKQHEAFILKVIEEVKSFEKGEKFVPNHFVRFLKDWLLEHIAVSDRKYRDFLKSKGL